MTDNWQINPILTGNSKKMPIFWPKYQFCQMSQNADYANKSPLGTPLSRKELSGLARNKNLNLEKYIPLRYYHLVHRYTYCPNLYTSLDCIITRSTVVVVVSETRTTQITPPFIKLETIRSITIRDIEIDIYYSI